MKKIARHIYLIWRRSRGDRRIKVGVIKRSDSGDVTFKYISEGIRQASRYGFYCYPDFPDTSKIYTDNVMDIFGQRLNNTDRSDIQPYFEFWEIDQKFKNDKFYVLAQTQGLLATDNFEFLASFHLTKDLKFISEIAGITHYNVPSKTLKIDDKLSWGLAPNNQYDPMAVKIFKGNQLLGYVKMIHNEIFHDKRAKNLTIKVKGIEENEVIHQVFIKIYVDNY